MKSLIAALSLTLLSNSVIASTYSCGVSSHQDYGVEINLITGEAALWDNSEYVIVPRTTAEDSVSPVFEGTDPKGSELEILFDLNEAPNLTGIYGIVVYDASGEKKIEDLIDCKYTPADELMSDIQMEVDKIACGSLGYIRGQYVLMADHGENYNIAEGDLVRNQAEITGKLRGIVENHNYDESDFPQACFEGITSKREGKENLTVKILDDVKEREFIQ